jgi:hypothetical protein
VSNDSTLRYACIFRSFGVLIWEVLTFGQQPYPARTNVEVLQYVRNGGRLERPVNCPDELLVYNLCSYYSLLSSWNICLLHDFTAFV